MSTPSTTRHQPSAGRSAERPTPTVFVAIPHRPLLPWLLMLLLTGGTCSGANAGPPHDGVFVSFSSQGLSYEKDGRHVRTPLKATMTEWAIDCTKRHLVAWGVPWAKIQPGDAPYSEVALVDIDAGQLMTEFSVSRGPYDAIYSQDGQLVAIDEATYSVITGQRVSEHIPADFIEERCADFTGKTSRNIRNQPVHHASNQPQ